MSNCRITLGPYRKRPGANRQRGARKRTAGALSIRAFEGSRWRGVAQTLMLWVLNVRKGVEVEAGDEVRAGEAGKADR
jgi:hypothetical protein